MFKGYRPVLQLTELAFASGRRLIFSFYLTLDIPQSSNVFSRLDNKVIVIVNDVGVHEVLERLGKALLVYQVASILIVEGLNLLRSQRPTHQVYGVNAILIRVNPFVDAAKFLRVHLVFIDIIGLRNDVAQQLLLGTLIGNLFEYLVATSVNTSRSLTYLDGSRPRLACHAIAVWDWSESKPTIESHKAIGDSLHLLITHALLIPLRWPRHKA